MFSEEVRGSLVTIVQEQEGDWKHVSEAKCVVSIWNSISNILH